jgi:hypothetical protein
MLLALSACSSSSSNFDQHAAIRGLDTYLAAFPPDPSTKQGPSLLSCPFGTAAELAAQLSKAAGVPAGALGRPTDVINPWSSGTDGGRAIDCGASSTAFSFDLGVQRGERDEHPTAGAQWKGPIGLGGGNMYVASTSKYCTVAWAKKGTFFTVGVQISTPVLSEAKCQAAGKTGVQVAVHALEKIEPFNVATSSAAPVSGPSSPSK